MHNPVRLIALAGLFVFSPSGETAENVSDTEKYLSTIFDSDGWMSGLSVITDESAYRNAANVKHTLLPFLAWDNGDYHIGTDEVSYQYAWTDRVEFKLLARPRWSTLATNDSDLFENIKRKDAIDAGLRAEAKIGVAYVRALVLADVSGAYDGHAISTTIGTQYFFGDALLNIGAGVSYQDQNLNTYQFGVRANEASEALRAYTPDSDWLPFGEISIIYPLDEKTAIVGEAHATHMSNQLVASPLVDSDVSVSVLLTLVHRF